MPSDVLRRITAFNLDLSDIEEVIGWHFGHTTYHDDHVEFSHGSHLFSDIALTLFLTKTESFARWNVGLA